MKLYSYTVIGKLPFPLDMLRYDNAWPRTPSAVEKIDPREQGLRTIELSSMTEPTAARWNSMGWKVGAVTARKV